MTIQEKVNQLLYEMLTESTGAHLLDSGGAYGRHWQENRKRTLDDFLAEPEVTPVFYEETLEYCTISVFHYLRYNLSLDELCDEFNERFIPAEDWKAEQVYGTSAAGEKFLLDRGARIHDTENTYNYGSILSQTLQYSILEVDGEYYILLQLHNGCDVRGGYTDARLFHLDEECLSSETVWGIVNRRQCYMERDDVLRWEDTNGEAIVKESDDYDFYI